MGHKSIDHQKEDHVFYKDYIQILLHGFFLFPQYATNCNQNTSMLAGESMSWIHNKVY
ncbi:UNVERIFIED_CONTAM: hypothetical protein FKN15_067435 [Acipenser sinensis]